MIIAALAGLILGSFLNVVILRLNTGRSTEGRSGCMSCGSTLGFFELIPVVSFFLLKGNCKSCGSGISSQYWMVEISTAILFALVWMKGFPLFETLISLVLVSLLVVIATYDIRHTIIPNSVVYTFIVVTFIANMATTPLIYMAFSGIVVALPLFLLWLVSKGQWMGFGDVKLTIGFGFLLGIYGGLMAVMLGFILGAVISLILLAIPKVMRFTPLRGARISFTMKSEVPFAPFLILGFILVFLFNVDLLALTDLFI
ncbi:hypothetical protein COB52_01265 [Candidatus Kaiserbacteria bacterium]|nr:MAG: hypothetical protein COB52_01265 [Candidatus Kaiserbacteria bacterium]